MISLQVREGLHHVSVSVSSSPPKPTGLVSSRSQGDIQLPTSTLHIGAGSWHSDLGALDVPLLPSPFFR
jgi:hypothetical protein